MSVESLMTPNEFKPWANLQGLNLVETKSLIVNGVLSVNNFEANNITVNNTIETKDLKVNGAISAPFQDVILSASGALDQGSQARFMKTINNIVTMYFPTVLGTIVNSTNTITYSSIPAQYRPVDNIAIPIFVIQSTSNILAGRMYIQASTGIISIINDTGAFPLGSASGFPPITASWLAPSP